MSILLFRLRHVPEDEADEVRALLEEHGIEYYETSAGNWRISMPAIWLKDEEQLPRARELLDRYQEERYRIAREQYEQARQSGEHRTLWDQFREDPVRVGLYIGGAAVVLYLSLQVFLSLG